MHLGIETWPDGLVASAYYTMRLHERSFGSRPSSGPVDFWSSVREEHKKRLLSKRAR